MASKYDPPLLLLIFTLILSLITLVLISPSSAAAARVNRLAASLRPKPLIIYPTLREIAKFAVREYNKEFNKDLVLKKVIRGDFTQGYNDRIYRVYIRVASRKDVLDSGVYVTFVQIRPLKHQHRDLIAFHQLSQ